MNLSLDTASEFVTGLQKHNCLRALAEHIVQEIGSRLEFTHCELYTPSSRTDLTLHSSWNPNCTFSNDSRCQEVARQVLQTGSASVLSEATPAALAAPILFNGKVIAIVAGRTANQNASPPELLKQLLILARLSACSLAMRGLTDGQGSVADGLVAEAIDQTTLSPAVLELLEEAIITVDLQHNVQHFSLRASELTGMDRSQALGQPIGEVFPAHGFTPNLLTDQPKLHVRDQMDSASGQAIQIRWSSAPNIVDGSVVGHVLVFQDITQQDYLERQAEKAQRNESLGVFVGGIAHDFNNNLQTTLSSLASARSKAPIELRPLLEVAERASERSRGLTNQLMAFAKGTKTEAERTDLYELVKATSTLILPSRHSNVEIQSEPGLHQTTVVRSQIEQVVANLLINASQSYERGGTVSVQLSNQKMPSHPQQPAVQIQISDQGRGIPECDLDQIFKPFYTTKPTGHGLGLATSYFIVQRHGGEISVESEVGKGTTIRVLLPVTPGEHEPTGVPTAHQEPGATKPVKILFIDDEPTVQQSVCAVIESLGHQAGSARNMEQAVQLFQAAIADESPYDLLIVDLNVPHAQGGLAILKQLRLLEPDVRAIVTSGYSNDPVMQSPEQYGFSGVLPKPFNRKKLQAEISRARQ